MQMSFSLTLFQIPWLKFLMENKTQEVLFVQIERSVHEGQTVFCLAVLELRFWFLFLVLEGSKSASKALVSFILFLQSVTMG